MALNRKVHRASARTKDANFALDGLVGFDLHGKTVTVVGCGKVRCQQASSAWCRVNQLPENVKRAGFNAWAMVCTDTSPLQRLVHKYGIYSLQIVLCLRIKSFMKQGTRPSTFRFCEPWHTETKYHRYDVLHFHSPYRTDANNSDELVRNKDPGRPEAHGNTASGSCCTLSVPCLRHTSSPSLLKQLPLMGVVIALTPTATVTATGSCYPRVCSPHYP